MSAEMELERLVVRIVGDAKDYFATLTEMESRTRSLGQTMQNALRGGGGSGGGGGGGGGNGGGVWNAATNAQPGNDLNQILYKINQQRAADEQKAQDSLGKQRQRALQGQVYDEVDARNQKNAARQRDYENEQRQQAAAMASLGNQKQKSYEKDQRDQQAQLDRDTKRLTSEYDSRQRKLDKAVDDKAKKDQSQLDRETKRLTSEYDVRQRKLEGTVKQQERDEQARFAKSNKLQERVDRDKVRSMEKAEKDKAKVQKDAEKEEARNAKQRQAEQERTDAERARARAQRSQDRAAITLGVGLTSAALAAPILAGGKFSVDAFASFDKAMTESTSIMQVTEEETRKMRDLAKDLAMSGKQGPDELAKSFYFMASAGMDAKQSMAALPQIQAFATAGAFDVALATSLANDSLKAMGMASKDAQENLAGLTRLTDTLVRGAAMSNATVQQLSMSISRTAGAAAKAFNRDITEVVAVLGAFADQGVKGELAGNRYSMLLRHLGASAIKHGQEQKQLGFAVFDSSGKMKGMGDIMENLERVLGPMSPQLRSAAMQAMGFEARMQQAILPLIGMSGTIKEYEETLRGAGGTTQMVAEKQMKAFQNQIDMTFNSIRVFAIEVGEMLAPAIAFVADGVREAVRWWRSFDESTKASLVSIAAFTALAFTVTSLTTAFTLLNVVTGGFPVTVLAVTAAVGSLGAGAGVAVAKLGGIAKAVEYLRGFARDAWQWFKPVIPAIESLWMTVKQVSAQALDDLWALTKRTWGRITGDAEVDWKKVRDNIQDAILYIEYSLRNLPQTADLAWAGIRYGAAVTSNFLLENWSTFVTGGSNKIFPFIARNWAKLWDNMDDNVRQRLTGMLLKVVVFSHNMAAALRGDFGAIRDFATNLPTIEVKFDELGAPIKIPALIRMQEEAKKEFDKLKDASLVGFAEFKRQWEVEQGIGKAIFKQSSIEELPDAFKKKGEETGEQFVQGLGKGLKHKMDFAEFGSQEALARIEAYKQAIGLGGRDSLGDFVKIGKGAGSFKVPEDNKRLRDEAAKADGTDTLKSINNGIKDVVKQLSKTGALKIVRF